MASFVEQLHECIKNFIEPTSAARERNTLRFVDMDYIENGMARYRRRVIQREIDESCDVDFPRFDFHLCSTTFPKSQLQL